MAITEAEAKTRWCPFARIVGAIDHIIPDDQAAFNRIHNRGEGQIPPSSLCIGSACMAWRQGHKRNTDWKASDHNYVQAWPKHPDDKEPQYIADPDHGFCGLACRP